MTPQSFVSLLVQEDLKAAGLVSDHYGDNDDLLVHLLLPDVLRLCVDAFHAGDSDLSGRLLALVERGLREGDTALRNAVLVSFVEDAGLGAAETAAFLESWPPDLLLAREAR